MENIRVLGKPVEAALTGLQKAATPDEVWKASVKLMRAAMPVYQIMLGLPSLGVVPMFMRATLRIPNLERFSELAPLNDAIRDRPLQPVARMSDHYSPDTPTGRAFLEEFLIPMGWRYGAAMLFWNSKGGFLGQLAAIRTGAQGDFSEAELNELRRLHPHMEAVVHRLFKLENAFAAHLSMEHAIDSLPLPIALVGWDGRLGYFNDAGREALSAWHRDRSSAARALKPSRKIPAEIQVACATLRKGWEKAVRGDDFSKVSRSVSLEHPFIPSFRAEIRLVEPRTGRALQPSFSIHFDLPPTQNAVTARALARLSKLTQAEREVARLAAAGDDNADIARALGTSLSTVRTHLRSVFRKLGITTRSRLAPLYPSVHQL